MESQPKLRFRVSEALIQNILLLFSLGFVLIFAISEGPGLDRMLDLLVHAIRTSPDFFQKIADYFQNVPSEHLMASLQVGAIFGAIGTAAFYSFNIRLDWRGGAFAALIGGLVGALGAQVLLYPTQHCSYAPGVDTAQYRVGIIVTLLSALLLLVPTWTGLLWWYRKANPDTSPGYFKGWLLPYGLLIPSLTFTVLFLYYPATQVMQISLKMRNPALRRERFACFENYVDLSRDVIYRNSFETTLYITFFVVLFSLALSLMIAVLASQKIKGIGFYRTLLIWPYAVSPVVTGAIFYSMFREGGTGLINWFLDRLLGIEPAWITDAQLAPWVIIAASVWNILGFNILFYMAGLQNIPQDLLEAASLDGANRVQRFWRITFPLLSPFTFFLLVTNITYSFYGIYGVIDILTQGGPPLGPAGAEGNATGVLIYKMYEDSFKLGAATAGQGAAQAVILFLMIATLTILQFRYIDRRVSYGG